MSKITRKGCFNRVYDFIKPLVAVRSTVRTITPCGNTLYFDLFSLVKINWCNNQIHLVSCLSSPELIQYIRERLVSPEEDSTLAFCKPPEGHVLGTISWGDYRFLQEHGKLHSLEIYD